MTFRHNYCVQYGAAVSKLFGRFECENSRFECNTYGAVWLDVCETSWRDCVFTRNSDAGSSLPPHLSVPLCLWSSGGELVRLRFEGNGGRASAGGVLHVGDTTVELVSCIFGDNEGQAGAVAASFHDSDNAGGVTRLTGCRITGNRGTSILSATNTTLELRACTIAQNATTFGAVLVFPILSSPPGGADLSNTILWDNSAMGTSREGAQLSGEPVRVNYCCVDGWTGVLGGFGNHGLDPRFADPLGVDGAPGSGDEDHRLLAGSPCIDAGNSDLLPADALDLDGDGDVLEPLPLDFAGLARTVDVASEPDTGRGAPPLVDMGCYEGQDCNANGVADAQDIADGASQDSDADAIPDECECHAAERYCIAAPSSAGPGAEIALRGTTSRAANDLVLVAAPVPDQPGIFFAGSSRLQVPFGDGYLCAGGAIVRLPVEVASGERLEHRVDFEDPTTALLTAGSTWNFQAWYRDPAAGGAGFNLSDALELTVCP